MNAWGCEQEGTFVPWWGCPPIAYGADMQPDDPSTTTDRPPAVDRGPELVVEVDAGLEALIPDSTAPLPSRSST